MKTITPTLKTHIEGDVTTLATCWIIVRADGTVFRFTDHDQDILFSGDVYKSSSGYDRSAVSNDASLAVDNLDILGIIDAEDVTTADLRNGLFDYARVEVFMVNWSSPDDGMLRLRAGRLGEVVLSHAGTFSAELRGLTQNLSQTIGELYSATCRADLGDARCGKTLVVATPWEGEHAYVKGDKVVPTYKAPRGVLVFLPNMGAETGDTTGWTASLMNVGSGSVASVTYEGVTTLPYEGSRFFYCEGIANGAMYYRDVLLADVGLAVGDEVWVRGFQVNTHTGADTGRFVLTSYNASNIALEAHNSEFYGSATQNEWTVRRTTHMIIPADTTKLRIAMEVHLVSGTYANHGFDALALMRYKDGEETEWPVFFECTAAGTSDIAAAEPSWPATADATVTDNDVTWTARTQYARTDEVVTPLDQRRFNCNGLGDSFSLYKGGVLEWLTGQNAGKVCEIKSVTIDYIELYLPVLYPIAANDVFTLLPGCKKTLAECRDEYDNVLNFRGEPFIPGNDEYFQYPDSK